MVIVSLFLSNSTTTDTSSYKYTSPQSSTYSQSSDAYSRRYIGDKKAKVVRSLRLIKILKIHMTSYQLKLLSEWEIIASLVKFINLPRENKILIFAHNF
jgi:hypothetical protein